LGRAAGNLRQCGKANEIPAWENVMLIALSLSIVAMAVGFSAAWVMRGRWAEVGEAAAAQRLAASEAWSGHQGN